MKKWTIRVYMCGDNNLSVDMAYALQDIREVAKTAQAEINILAYYDGNLPDVPTYYFDFSDYDNQIQVSSAELTNKRHPLNKRVKKGINENAAYANSVINFVDWCVNKVEYIDEDRNPAVGRRAENYALIFSGHSFGFQDIGLFKDENADYTMTHNKLTWVFKELTRPEAELEEGDTLILGQKLGILGFDSCVMSMLEVGFQFHRFAETLIASEGSVPNAGWTYGKLLSNICGKEEAVDVHKTAKNFVHEFIKGESEFAIGGVSVDMAAWDCAKVPLVTDAFEKLATVLLTCIKDEKSTICRQMRRILLQVHWNCQSYMYEQNIDLKDFCRLLFEEVVSLEEEFGHNFGGLTRKLKDACFKVMQTLEDCIILSGFCGGQYQFSNGMSLFFPWTLPSYQVSQRCYENLAFFKKTNAGKEWNKFLKFYLHVVTIRYPQNVVEEPGTEALTDNVLSTLSKPQIFEYAVKNPKNLLNKIPQNPFNKIPQNAANKIPQNAANKIPQNSFNKGLNGGNGHAESGAENKIPQNAFNKLPWDPNTKIPQNAFNKSPVDDSQKIPQNSANKIPQNSANKLFGGMSSFFHYFMGMKNVITPWNVYGFTKQVEELEEKVYNESVEVVPVVKDVTS